MSFLTIIPYGLVNNNNGLAPLQLKVIKNPTVTRNLNRKRYQTYNTSKDESSFVFYDSGDAKPSFKVKVIVSRNDSYDGESVFSKIDDYYTRRVYLSIVADTEIIPNDVYVISDLPEYEAIRNDYYELTLEFTKYSKVTYKLTNKCTVLQSRLKQCRKPSDRVYSVNQIRKNKAKAGLCIGYVNQALYSCGLLSKKTYVKYKNYWTRASKNSLIRFQKRWNKKGLKPKLNQKGRIDNNTWNALKRYTEL